MLRTVHRIFVCHRGLTLFQIKLTKDGNVLLREMVGMNPRTELASLISLVANTKPYRCTWGISKMWNCG